jgi:hypothetical protein
MINEQGTPIAVVDLPPTPAPIELLPPAWDGASRINILFIGLDYRDWIANKVHLLRHHDPITVDPLTKSAGMLSITGYVGEHTWSGIQPYQRHTPAKPAIPRQEDRVSKTVEKFYRCSGALLCQVDFGTFTDFIDCKGDRVNVSKTRIEPVGPGYDPLRCHAGMIVVLIDGNANTSWVQIEFQPARRVPAGSANSVRADGLDGLPIVAGHEKATPTAVQVARIDTTIGVDTEDIRPSPKNPNMVMVKCCGLVHMDGNRALAFARTRKTEGGDVDRAHRQQSVIEHSAEVFNVEIFLI